MLELDCKVTPAPEMVVLREIDSAKVSAGGFYLSDDILTNSRTSFCTVESIGSVAGKNTGLVPGDYVLADKLASHYHTHPLSIMKWDNILLKTNKERSEFFPMPGWALLELVEEGKKNAFVVDSQLLIRHGIVKAISYGDLPEDECPFAVGDDVMVTRACDLYDGFGGATLAAMKIHEIIARFDK